MFQVVLRLIYALGVGVAVGVRVGFGVRVGVGFRVGVGVEVRVAVAVSVGGLPLSAIVPHHVPQVLPVAAYSWIVHRSMSLIGSTATLLSVAPSIVARAEVLEVRRLARLEDDVGLECVQRIGMASKRVVGARIL